MPSTPLSTRRRAATWSSLLFAGLAFAGCGGGSDTPAGSGPAIAQFTSDRNRYYVGEDAQLTVAYSGGAGRIEPGIGAVASGATVQTRALDRTVTYRLVVESAGRAVERTLTLPVEFRDRYVALPAPFIVSEHAAVAAGDGSVLVFGGSRGLSTLSEAIDRFDPATRLFTRVGSMRTGRSGHTATRLADGRVLVLGGGSSLQIGNVADVVDERTGAVSHGGELVMPRFWHATTLLADGRVLVSGGHGRDTVEIWDPATNVWRLVDARMALPRSHHTATLLADGRVLIAGGFSEGMPYRFAEVFDPADERFTAVDWPANQPRRFQVTHRTADGSVLLVGGEAEVAGTAVPTAGVLRFDPATNRILDAAPLSVARTMTRSVVLPNDRIVMFGGEAAIDVPTATGERYDAGAGGVATAVMPSARALHTVHRLPDGRILVLGGTGAGGAYVPQVLLYE